MLHTAVIEQTSAHHNRMHKTIITVQHTESQHHVNGHAGGWGDWELTEFGREQAFQIGKWLYNYEACGNCFNMYVSDLKRASQTAEEINKTLQLTPTVTEVIRELNAGAGNGKPLDWFKANQNPQGGCYNPDYKPFEDAETDRELWERLYPFYRELMSNSEEQILVVSHGVTLSFLQSMLIGDCIEDRKKRWFKGMSGSISKIIIEPDGQISIKYINQRILISDRKDNKKSS